MAYDNKITDEEIDLAIETLEDMEEGKLEKLFNRLAEQQPHAVGFVLGLGEGLNNEEAEEDLLYLVMIMWFAIESNKKAELNSISEEEMENLQHKIDERLERIMSFAAEEEEDEFEVLISESSQPALVSYLSDEFFSEEYARMPEMKVAKMFSCLSVLAETLS
ncbi:MAG: hypothetical protein CL840_01990 [Crocinitomicaceae bacterium]|nr:hypothetical protein [Crocinitomicaceae bacterium]|tara:strand:+ start:4124 stop:4612 length:489 start_codon:yes stop_codon:yes gene_type:complete